MNIKDIELIKLREQVFDNYREAIDAAKRFDEELNTLKKDLELKHNAYRNILEEINDLKALIDIMILEDCDPVTAKLRHEDLIAKHKEEPQQFTIKYNDFGYASNGLSVYNTIYNHCNSMKYAGTSIDGH